MVELLMVLAIVGILAALGATLLRPPLSKTVANGVRSFVQEGRFQAIKANRAVAIVWDGGSRSFHMVEAQTAGTVECTSSSTTLLRTLPVAKSGDVSIALSYTDGIVWLPTGQLRRCDNSVAGDSTITVSYKAARKVLVYGGGKVMVQ